MNLQLKTSTGSVICVLITLNSFISLKGRTTKVRFDFSHLYSTEQLHFRQKPCRKISVCMDGVARLELRTTEEVKSESGLRRLTAQITQPQNSKGCVRITFQSFFTLLVKLKSWVLERRLCSCSVESGNRGLLIAH